MIKYVGRRGKKQLGFERGLDAQYEVLVFFNADGWNADGDTSIADRYGEVAKLMISFFHNSVNELGLQPRIGPVQQGPGEGSREGSREGSAEGLGGFGTEPGQFRRRFRRRSGRLRAGQVQQGSEEGSRRRSGRLWCRARSGSTGFPRRFGEGAGRVPEKVWEASVQVQPVRFNKVPKKVPGEGLGGFGAEPGQVQQGSEKVPGRVPDKVSEKVWEDPVQLVRFNKVPKKVPGEGLQVQQGSGEGSEKLPGRFPEKVLEKVWEALVQSQVSSGEGSGEGLGGFGPVRCNKVPKKVPGEGLGGFGAEPDQVQQGSWEGSEKVQGGFRRRSGRLRCRCSRSGSTRFRRRFPEKVWEALVQSQVRFNRVRRRFQEGFRRRFRRRYGSCLQKKDLWRELPSQNGFCEGSCLHKRDSVKGVAFTKGILWRERPSQNRTIESVTGAAFTKGILWRELPSQHTVDGKLRILLWHSIIQWTGSSGSSSGTVKYSGREAPDPPLAHYNTVDGKVRIIFCHCIIQWTGSSGSSSGIV